MKKLIYLFAFLVIVTGCNSKKTSEENQKEIDSSDVKGEYECYLGSVGEQYLYYKLNIEQKGDSIGGSVFSGFYLSKNDSGYYTMPSATMTNQISGKSDGADAIVYLGKVLDSARMDNTYQFPDVRSLFGEDAEGDAVQTLYRAGKNIQIRSEEDTLVFEPVKKN
jgi:hypothetical protein